MSSAERQPHRPDIDGLRGIAVIGVVLFHLGLDSFPGGYVGVDVFFVISGFLITRLILADVSNERFSFARFYARRARRILPALLSTVASCLIFGFLLMSPPHYERLAQASVYATLAVSNFFFFSESGYFDVDSSSKPLLHTWSLGVEEQFYFFWPLLLFQGSKVLRGWTPFVIFALGAMSLYFSETLLGSTPSASFYLAPFRAFELLLGATLVWVVAIPQRSRWLDELLVVLGLGLMIAPMMMFTEHTEFPGLHAMVPCVGAALSIYSGDRARSGFVLRNVVAVSVGKISYSLYLVHWPIIIFYTYWNFGPLDPGQTIIAAVLSLVCATLMFGLIESPFRERRTDKVHPAPAKIAFIFGGIAGLIVASASVISSQGGWSWRIEDSLNIPRVNDDVNRTRDVCRMVSKDSRLTLCEFAAEPGDRYDYLMLGDSHAEHLLYGLDRVFREKRLAGLYVSTGANNVPFKDGRLLSWGKPGPTNDDEYEYLEGVEFDSVILAARWHLYTNSKAHDQSAPRIYTWGEYQADEIESSHAALAAGAKHTVEYFRNRGKEVYIFGQVPPFGPDPNLCFNRPEFGLSGNRCGGFPKSKIFEIARQSDNLFEELSTELGFTFVNLTRVLCEDDCRSVIDGTYIYRDDDHLNRFGSEILVRQVFGAGTRPTAPAPGGAATEPAPTESPRPAATASVGKRSSAAAEFPTASRKPGDIKVVYAPGDSAEISLTGPLGVATDEAGNLFVAGSSSDNVIKITPDGAITEILDAGGDGRGASLTGPVGTATDAAGNVIVTGFRSNNVFKIAPDGTITEILDASGDGAVQRLAGPVGVATDTSGNVFVAGFKSNNVFKIAPDGTIAAIVAADGDGSGSLLRSPWGIATYRSGSVFVAGRDSFNVCEITPDGTATEVIESTGDGAGNRLDSPLYVATDTSGNVFVTAFRSDNVFKLAPDATTTEIIDAGAGGPKSVTRPWGIVADAVGNVFVTGRFSHNVLEIAPTGRIVEVLDATGDGDGNPLEEPRGIAADASGNVFVSGFRSDNVFKISRSLGQGATLGK